MGNGAERTLTGALTSLADELRHLRTDIRADSKQRRRESLLSIGLALVLVLLMVGMLFVGWQNHSIGDQIADCTTAGGRCYEEGRRRSSEGVDRLIRSNIHLHRCLETPGVDTDAEVIVCMERRSAN